LFDEEKEREIAKKMSEGKEHGKLRAHSTTTTLKFSSDIINIFGVLLVAV